jgi:hypothetical protein
MPIMIGQAFPQAASTVLDRVRLGGLALSSPKAGDGTDQLLRPQKTQQIWAS